MKKNTAIALASFSGFFIGFICNNKLLHLNCPTSNVDKFSKNTENEKNTQSILEESFFQVHNELKNYPEDIQYSILLQMVINLIKSEYVLELSDEKLTEKAISGLMSNMDPHSRYLTSETMDIYDDIVDGEFGGIGTMIMTDEGFIRITSVLDDSPAYKAGLKNGDLIIYVNDDCVNNITIDEVSKKLRGKPKTKVKLKIKRGKKNPFDITVTRDVIKIPSVKCEYLNNICYIRIALFVKETTESLKKILLNLKNQKEKVHGIVLDLRDNPGGLLSEAVSVADIFLDGGKQIVFSKGRREENLESFKSTGKDLTKNLPLVLLINNGTISAPEIVAGALQDNKRALIVGVRSYGKGSVQKIFPISKKAAIKLTVARYYTPSGKSVQAQGISPDIEADFAICEHINDPFIMREEFYTNALDADKNVQKKKNLDEENKKSLDALEKPKDQKENLELRFRKMTLQEKIKFDYQLEKAFDVVNTMYKCSQLLENNILKDEK